MRFESLALAVTLTAGMLAATSANAFFSCCSDRPPPNGSNGLATNGVSLEGLVLDVTALKGVTLADGTLITLD